MDNSGRGQNQDWKISKMWKLKWIGKAKNEEVLKKLRETGK